MATNPHGVRSHVDSQEQLRREALYHDHRETLRAAGHDPDYIGTTEVKPPCCPGCGARIPWPVLNLYR
jgi:hypothetical protein